ncbi:hypothetical protein K449DRAFT_463187 [Hypoxylon sp. EC38]|nr:hypothetical protein K449DRAFT_463187 [Hypoxylon sp. EC38]
MFTLKELIVRAGLLLSRSSTIPAVCYDVCNNAYIAAQQEGKTPALCAADSNFTIYYETCDNCTAETGGAENITDLAQFVNYCEGISPSSSTLTSSSSGSVAHPSTSTSALSFHITQTVLPWSWTFLFNTTTNGGIPTTWSFTAEATVYAPIPATAVVQIINTVNGIPQTYTFTTTYAQLPTDFANGAASDPTSTTSIPSLTPTPEPSASPNRAWIAGPVVGGVAGVSIVALGGLLLWRRRQKQLQASIRPELHGIDAIKSEMEVPNRPQELDANKGAGHNDEPQELAAERL